MFKRALNVWAWAGLLVALLFAWNQYGIARAALEEAENKTKIAEKEKAEADRQRIKANTSARIAAEKTKLAEDANIKAQQSLRKAEQEEAKAKVALHQVEKEKAATEEQRQAAQRNYELAQQKTQEAEATLLEVKKTTVQVVKNILEDAAAQIHKLDYAAAVERLHDAARLVQEESGDSPLAALKPAVADGLLEAAFFFTETDRYLCAKVEAGKAAELLGVSAPLLDQVKAAGPESRQALRQTLRALRPERYAALQSRYYPVMIPLAGGEYWMGCDSTVDECGGDDKRHRVRLRSFQLAETETTFWQYHLFLAASGKNIFKDHPAVGWGFEGDNPAVNVSWYDAVAYANWLSARFGLQPAYRIDSTDSERLQVSLDTAAAGYRLPTEAEWEYAARGGSNQRSFIYAGADQSALDSVAWYWGNSESRTRAVRSKKPNTAGLYDMSGNVWEWCWDWRGDYPDELQVDPRGPEKGDYRVLRGGGWYSAPRYCRVAYRYYYGPGYRSYSIGFRLVRPF
jgi:formylglycine-generating enzyme required for sulfatase activity